MKSDAISDLKLFNEKAALLLNSSFANAILRNQSAFMFSWKAGENYEAILVGAEGESVDAAFLTLRMFLQNNDRISIGNIANLYLQEQELNLYQADFENIRSQINVYLDSGNGISFFGNNYSNRSLIELLLYGSKGHSNREKEQELKKLLDSPLVSKMFLNQVNSAAGGLIKGIATLAEINKTALSSINLDDVQPNTQIK